MANRERVRVNGEGFFAEEIETPGVTPGGVPARPASPEEIDLWERRAVEARETAPNGILSAETLMNERREHQEFLARHSEG